MFVYRTRGIVAATVGVLALGACTDPVANTDLRPDGPPDVLAVLVENDAAGGLLEAATFCKINDEKRPGLVGTPDGAVHQICPAKLTCGAGDDASCTADQATVTDAAPQGWYVRVMFDELLDPNVEELVPVLDASGADTGTFSGTIANTRPVTLQCQSSTGGALVDVPYDGYYSPSGNAVTWPLGPSIVIKPLDPETVGADSECQVTLKDTIKDKSGELVPAAERGPFKFKIAGIKVLSVAPADGDVLDPFDAGMDVLFNTKIDPASMVARVSASPAGVTETGTTATFTTQTPHNLTVGEVVTVLGVTAPGYDGNWAVTGVPTATTFTVTLPTSGLAASGGGTVAVNEFTPDLANQFAIGLSATGSFIPAFGSVPTVRQGAEEWIVVGDFNAKTDYTWTIPAGTKVKDMCGKETTFGAPSVADNTKVSFKLNDIAFQGLAPSDGLMNAAPVTKVKLDFNQTMDPDSLDPSEYTLTPTVASISVAENPVDGSKLDIYGDFQLNTTYTFTLKAGATIDDCPGGEVGACVKSGTFTNATAQTITFKTAPAITLTAITPKDNAVITKFDVVSPLGRTSIKLQFNQEMDPSTLTTADYTIDPAVPLVVSQDPDFSKIRLRAVFPPGTYTFTLKAGAQISDFLGNVFTNAADQVIHFTIKDPTPFPRCL
jgi:hypothetical protein